ncbi:hypothetical protein AB3N61_06605 [Leptospira sp. WS58.C1]|uniref:hypothetical protein n=1 Tax=Leptospira cinconiae TaxID=3235173 RepID=UPI00349E9CD0
MDTKKFVKRLMAYGSKKYGLLYDRWVIFGVRGINFKNGIIEANNDAINEYNDALFLIRIVNKSLEFKVYSCTIDPGRYWLNQPMNPAGTARIAEGVYKYKLGMHKGHKALNQYAKVTVNRYAPHQNAKPWFKWKDESFSVSQTGFFAINIHAKSGSSKFVEMASAGCTVLNATWTDQAWLEFYATIESAISTHSQGYICYCVLDQSVAVSILS